MTSVIGIDLGGTKTAVARYRLREGSLILDDAQRLPTHADRGVRHVLDTIVQIVGKMRKEDTTGVGIGVPGLVQQPEGIVLTLPNIPGEKNLHLKEELGHRLGLPVAIENDANCFAFAEAMEGAGKGRRVVVGITLGTGVGGGIVIDGKIFEGAHGYAGEIGHMLLKPGEPPYETEDRRGDIEQFLSGTALGKRCTEAKKPEDYLEGETCGYLRPDIFREVAWMCVNLVHLLDPSIIIFGGSAGRALGNHLPEIHAALDQWILPGTPHPELAQSALDDAALRGAALLCV